MAQRVDVKGSVPSLRPRVRYAFSDPELEARSAGHRILLCIGPEPQRWLKAKPAEVRRLVTQPTSGGN